MACDSSDLLSPSIGWRIARILVDREARVSAVVTVLSRSRRRGDFGFDFAGGRNGLPDDLKPPIATGVNVVVDRRCGALSDHCLGGTLSVLAQCEARSSGVHRFLLLMTTTHTRSFRPHSPPDCVV